MTLLVHDKSAFRNACEDARARGLRVGLVPTMGALHEGHLALTREAKARGATFRVATIFVNPSQFGPDEDFSRYPRTLEADIAKLRDEAVDLVFAPAPDAMYPEGFETHVEVEKATLPFEGAHRPGHFRGVTTVVAKLFNLTGPCVAVFGRKDYQQWRVIERMVRDLDMPIEVVGHPIVRETDGLALSSRNRYLSDDERTRALALSTGLRAAKTAYDMGERRRDHLEATAREIVAQAFDVIDYVSVAHAESLAPLAEGDVGDNVVMLAAAHLGKTRLIDNLAF